MLNHIQCKRAVDRFEDWMLKKAYVITRRIWRKSTKKALDWWDAYSTLTDDEKLLAFEIFEEHQSRTIYKAIERREKVIRVTNLGQFWINPLRAYILDNGIDSRSLSREDFRKLIYEAFGSDFKIDRRTGKIIINTPHDTIDSDTDS